MKFVEQFPSFRWGNDLRVTQDGDTLLVSGGFPLREWYRPAADIFAEYLSVPRNFKKGTAKESPHIRFANANTDKELIEFVRRFGPVVACSFSEEDPGDGDALCAQQDMNELRSEQFLYKAALGLISALSLRNRPNEELVRDYIAGIVKGVKDWPRQWEREQKERRAKGDRWELDPDWRFDEWSLERVYECEVEANFRPKDESSRRAHRIFGRDHIDAAHDLLCELVNAFRIRAYRWVDKAIEGPRPDLRFGIRPLLYYILRRAYLFNNSVAICANGRCCQVFEVERENQRFCDEICSRQYRQREYWKEIGKERRQNRLSGGKNRPKSKAGKARY